LHPSANRTIHPKMLWGSGGLYKIEFGVSIWIFDPATLANIPSDKSHIYIARSVDAARLAPVRVPRFMKQSRSCKEGSQRGGETLDWFKTSVVVTD
jgi:hypothetical protein